MRNKIVTLIAVGMFVAGFSGSALAGEKEVSAEVTKVLGNKITVEIQNGMAKDISVGDKVKMEVEKKKAKEEKKPSPGMDMLQGC